MIPKHASAKLNDSNISMRVKSAAPGGRIHGESRRHQLIQNQLKNNQFEGSSTNNKGGKMSTLDSGVNEASVDITTLSASEGKNKNRSTRLFNQSFYRMNQNGIPFEKIPHEKKRIREQPELIISPYKDESTLEMEANTSVGMKRKQGGPKSRKSATSMKKHRVKKGFQQNGIQGSQQNLIIENPINQIEPTQGGVFQRPPIDAIFPSSASYFNQSILHNFRPFANGYPKNSVFNPLLDNKHQMNRKGGNLNTSNQYSGPMTNGQGSQSSSPQKRPTGLRLINGGTVTQGPQFSNSKKDILSCLEISRIDSNRRPESNMQLQQQKAYPGQNPGGILNQEKKPFSRGNNAQFRPMTSSTKGAQNGRIAKTVSRLGHSGNENNIQDAYTENSTTIGTKSFKNNGNSAPSATVNNQSFSQILGGAVLLTNGFMPSLNLVSGSTLTNQIPSNTNNTSRYEAYHQFQEFKERFIADQVLSAKSKDLSAKGSSPQDNIDNENKEHMQLRNGKSVNLLQHSRSQKEIKDQGNTQEKKAQCNCQKQVCDCQEPTPTNLMISNIMRSRHDSSSNVNQNFLGQNQTQYMYVLPKTSVDPNLRSSQQYQAAGIQILNGGSSHLKTASNTYQMYQSTENNNTKTPLQQNNNSLRLSHPSQEGGVAGEYSQQQQIIGLMKKQNMTEIARAQRNGPQNNPSSSMHAVMGAGRLSNMGFKSRQDKSQSRQGTEQEGADIMQNQLIQIVQIEARRSSLDRRFPPNNLNMLSHLNSGIEAEQIIQLQQQMLLFQKTPTSHRQNAKGNDFGSAGGGSKHMFMSYYERKRITEEQIQQRNALNEQCQQPITTVPYQHGTHKHLRKSNNLKKALNAAGVGISTANKTGIEYETPFDNVRGSVVIKQPTTQQNALLQNVVMSSQQFAAKFQTSGKKSSQLNHSSKEQIQTAPSKNETAVRHSLLPEQLVVSSYSRQQSMLNERSSVQSRKRQTLFNNHYLAGTIKDNTMQHNQSKNSTILQNGMNDSNSQIDQYMDETQYEEGMDFQELPDYHQLIPVSSLPNEKKDTKGREMPAPVLFQPVLMRHRTTKQSSYSQQPSEVLGANNNKVPNNNKPSSSGLQFMKSSQTNGGQTSQLQKKTKNFQLQQMSQSEKVSPIKSKKQGGIAKSAAFENPHKNHKINQVINLANEFLQETFLRTNDQPVNIDRVKYICQTYFGIKLPRNFISEPYTVKTKEFQVQAKERILQKMYEVINSENQVSQEWIQQSLAITVKKFYVGKGNNYPLVRSIIKQRWWWQLNQEGEDFNTCQMIWTSWRKNDLLDYLKPLEANSTYQHDGKLRIYNRLEDNFHLSNKKALFFNMTQYYKQLGEDPFCVLPLTFHIEHGLSDPEFQQFKTLFTLIEEEKRVKSKELERKKKEYIKEKRKKEGYGSEDEGGDEDEEEYLADIFDIEEHFGVKVPKNIWIMKPGENSNRGNGIFVCNTLKEIIAEINSPDKKEHTHIIQRYIERPLLIHNRKFDIRVYGMLTSVNGIHKGYFYEDGYIRTSSTEFDLEDLSNRFIHLTNDAVQKNSDDYGKFENGNKVSYQNFQKYIDTHIPAEKRINFHKEILPQIRKIIADTFKATFMKLDPKRRLHSFEIFGYDFMIEEDYKVYLIEANTNPCLELSCPLLARIIPAMLDSAFRIALDPLFPPKADSKKNVNTLPELLPVNKFELVFDERIEGAHLREVLKNQEAFNLKIDVNEECGDGDPGEDEDGQDELQQDAAATTSSLVKNPSNSLKKGQITNTNSNNNQDEGNKEKSSQSVGKRV